MLRYGCPSAWHESRPVACDLRPVGVASQRLHLCRLAPAGELVDISANHRIEPNGNHRPVDPVRLNAGSVAWPRCLDFVLLDCPLGKGSLPIRQADEPEGRSQIATKAAIQLL